MRKVTDDKDDDLNICMECGLILTDDQPRAAVITRDSFGVICVGCAEKDTTSLKLGSPKNPANFGGQ
jgi:hypothetical protein